MTNRMTESLDLFEETINGQVFKDTQIILFLNKTDVFKEKIDKTDLNVCFPEYDGGRNFDKACRFIEQKFLVLNKFDLDRIITHFTCATNTDNIKNAMEDVKRTVAKKNATANGAL